MTVGIESIDYDRRVIVLRDRIPAYERPPWSCICIYLRNNRFRVENVLEELTQEGEWCLDGEDGTLYSWPPQASSLEKGEVILPMLDKSVELREARHVVIRGLTFSHTLDGGNCHRDGLVGYGALFPFPNLCYCGEAVRLGLASHCVIEHNVFEQARRQFDLYRAGQPSQPGPAKHDSLHRLARGEPDGQQAPPPALQPDRGQRNPPHGRGAELHGRRFPGPVRQQRRRPQFHPRHAPARRVHGDQRHRAKRDRVQRNPPLLAGHARQRRHQLLDGRSGRGLADVAGPAASGPRDKVQPHHRRARGERGPRRQGAPHLEHHRHLFRRWQQQLFRLRQRHRGWAWG